MRTMSLFFLGNSRQTVGHATSGELVLIRSYPTECRVTLPNGSGTFGRLRRCLVDRRFLCSRSQPSPNDSIPYASEDIGTPRYPCSFLGKGILKATLQPIPGLSGADAITVRLFESSLNDVGRLKIILISRLLQLHLPGFSPLLYNTPRLLGHLYLRTPELQNLLCMIHVQRFIWAHLRQVL